MHRVGVMISGSATTFEAFCLQIKAQELPIEVPVLVADREAANLEIAERMNRLLGWKIRPILLDRAAYPGGATKRRWDLTDEQSEALLRIVQDEGVDVLSQQGWLSRTRGIVHYELGEQPDHELAIQSCILNNHPAIPEDTAGLYGINAHRRAAELGRTAFTVHTVSDGYDEGIVYAQVPVPVLDGDVDIDVERSVQAVEKAFTPGIILRFAQERAEYVIVV